jgi:LPS export ABC transporter permease LptG/LPS export ABC transporter permease LptF
MKIMRLLSRAIFKEIAAAAIIGITLFTVILLLRSLGGDLFSLLVRTAASPRTVALMVGLAIPFALPNTVPLGVLVGVLIGLSRLSSDGEVTAMRSAGVSGRRIAVPALAVAFLAMLGTAAASLWLTPWSYREANRIAARLAASQLTAEVQPRIFAEQFQEPKVVLYVGEVTPTPGNLARWRDVFIADAPSSRPAGIPTPDAEEVDSASNMPRVMLAHSAIARPDAAKNRIQLSLLNRATYEVTGTQYRASLSPTSEQLLEAEKPGEARTRHPELEMDSVPLWNFVYRTPHGSEVSKQALTEHRIEIQKRLSLPMACLLLALVGIPLGVSTRRASKSAAFVMTLAVAFAYYMGQIGMMNVARQGRVPVELAVWTPNLVFAIIGVILMIRLEVPGDRDLFAYFRRFFHRAGHAIRGAVPSVSTPASVGQTRRLIFLPQLIDTYVLTGFLFWFSVVLLAFVMISHVYTFFELLSDIIRNQIPLSRVFTYLFFLTPKFLYDSAPISVLVSVLVTFGVLSKSNEVTAFLASGVSVYRLAAPIVMVAILFSGGLFAFDHLYVPKANRIQDAIRNEIKGRPVQTYLRPDQKWINGLDGRIYYYRYFDPSQNAMLDVNVYEVDWKSAKLKRHISAERARWEPSIKRWIFQNGWKRDFDGIRETDYDPFSGDTRTFDELTEAPDYFLKEVKQGKQMNAQELEKYIAELRQRGFDTIQLQVQFHKKFSVPLFALIMALIGIPFAFRGGTRGAMAAVGISFSIAIAYIALNQLFEQVGNLNQLPPSLAAWAPDGLFSLAGMYFVARMRS